VTERGDKANLIQPAEMARRFPRALAYLTARRAALERRNIVGGTAADRQFYQFGRSQSLTKFNTPKIILPILSLEPRYAYDDADTVVTGGGNGPYYMVRAIEGQEVSDFYLLAVLNHPLSEAFVRTNTSSFHGGYYSHGKQFIEDLPVPTSTPQQRAQIEAIVAELIGAHGTLAVARTPHEQTVQKRRIQTLRTRIETRVTALFGLSAADMEIVQAVQVAS